MFYTQYTFAFFYNSFNLIPEISLHITLEQVFENLMALPPAPQKPSRTVSQRIFPAMCSATASGVTLYQDSSSSEIP